MGRTIRQLARVVILAMTGVALVATPVGAKPVWQPVTNMYADLSVVGGWAQSPDVAVDAAGNATAVWTRWTGSGVEYVVQASTRQAGGAWSPPVDLTTGSNARGARVVLDTAGNATAIWRMRNDQATAVQTASRPAGGAWSAVLDLSTAVADLAYAHEDVPQIAVDDAGNVTAAWSHYESGRFTVKSASRPAGGAWTTPVDLSAPDHNSAHPALTLDPAGNATVVWAATQAALAASPGAPEAKIQAASRPAGGAWSAPVDVTAAGPKSYAFPPRVAVDAAGEATAVWLALDGTYVVKSATRPAHGLWTTPITLSDPGADSSDPDVAVDGQGTTTAIWRDHDGDNWIAKASTRPAGGAWSRTVDLSPPGQDAMDPQVIGDRAGNTTAWWTRTDDTTERVQAARRPVDGVWSDPIDLSAPGEGPSDVPFLTTGQANNPEIAVDPAGNVTSVWSRFDGHTWIVQARGLDAAGPVVTALTSPVTGTEGQVQEFSVKAYDVWSTVDKVVWNFGDGTTATGTSVTHMGTTDRARPVKVTLTDAVGNVTLCRTTCRSLTGDAPVIARARLRPARIEISGPKRRTRTQVVVRLNEQANVTLTVKRKGVTGKKARQKVVLRKSLDAGHTKLRLTSKQLKRKLGKRHFKPGRYKLTLKATNTAGKDRRSVILRVRR